MADSPNSPAPDSAVAPAVPHAAVEQPATEPKPPTGTAADRAMLLAGITVDRRTALRARYAALADVDKRRFMAIGACLPDCTCRGETDESAELLAALENVQSQKVRRNLIAYHTAEQLTCPHCQVGPGVACVTFPRGRHATFTHASRVKARLAQVELRLAQVSVPTQ